MSDDEDEGRFDEFDPAIDEGGSDEELDGEPAAPDDDPAEEPDEDLDDRFDYDLGGEEDDDDDVDLTGLEEVALPDADEGEGEDGFEDDEPSIVYSPVYLAEHGAVSKRGADTEAFAKLSNTHREIRIIPADERTTDHRLHKCEIARAIAIRAKQISDHPTEFTDCDGISFPHLRAQKELYDRRSPLRLRRYVGRDGPNVHFYEEWVVREMTLPPLN